MYDKGRGNSDGKRGMTRNKMEEREKEETQGRGNKESMKGKVGESKFINRVLYFVLPCQ